MFEENLETIETLSRLTNRLRVRMKLIRFGFATKTPYEKNEIGIVEDLTSLQIRKYSERLNQAVQQFQEVYIQKIQELEFQQKNE